ncbi:MAG: YfcE family phosphodiesterase [Oscillospiraceae bacterium]|nr:YfcE family phosphodiesterase [Oscillospiraceae bacterium]
MKKIVVFSDSHGTLLPMRDVVADERPDHILFLGDGWTDSVDLMRTYPGLPILRVPGNCDYQPGEQTELLVELYGKRIFMCHGHTLRVKSGLGGLLARAHRFGADIALYGHTHQGYCDIHQGMWVMNPGSMSRYASQTYGVITIDGDSVYCGIHRYER